MDAAIHPCDAPLDLGHPEIELDTRDGPDPLPVAGFGDATAGSEVLGIAG